MSNFGESNLSRNPINDWFYIERAKKLIGSDKIEEWEILVKSRGIEITFALDFLELLQYGVDVKEAISIFANKIDEAVKSHRIIPMQGYIARDIVSAFSSFGPEFATMIPEDSFLHLDAQGIQKKIN